MLTSVGGQAGVAVIATVTPNASGVLQAEIDAIDAELATLQADVTGNAAGAQAANDNCFDRSRQPGEQCRGQRDGGAGRA